MIISESELKAIALSELARVLSEKSEGMADFSAWVLARISAHDRKAVERFRDAKSHAAPVLAALWDEFENEQKRKAAKA